MAFRRANVAEGIKHLQAVDPILGKVIELAGPFRLKVERDRFRALVSSIISQQISGSAARTIKQRVEALIHPDGLSAEAVHALEDQQLRGAGMSAGKIKAVRDLCEKVLSGKVQLARLGRLTDSEVIQELTQIHGIGEWTAQMFLMFSLGRIDVFASNDLGIRAAIQKLYQLDEMPRARDLKPYQLRWSPYGTIACWYCWRSHELSFD